jgi:hypothetical protein
VREFYRFDQHLWEWSVSEAATNRRKARLVCVLVAGGVLVLALALGTFICALRYVPGFYSQSRLADIDGQRKGNDAMLETATALANTSRREGNWYAQITEQQINGWLAVDLVQNHQDLLPPAVGEPRVHIEPGRAIVACTYQYCGLSTVVTATFEMYLAEPRVVALRIHATRAGLLPVPMTPIVDGVAKAAERLNLRVEWRQMHGDPVALITLPAAQTETTVYRLDAFELRNQEIYLAGRTGPLQVPDSPSSEPARPQSDVAARPDENLKIQ